MHFSLSIFAAFSLLTRLPPPVGGAVTNATRSIVSHSLPESYKFDSRDGWDSVMVTNLRYKYRRSPTPLSGASSKATMGKGPLKRPSSTRTEHSSIKNAFRSVGKSIAELTKSIIAIGEPEPVTITWYTGQDLLNPSCWTKPQWAPTDNSFVAALTLDGWSEKPKCFKFLEICNSNKNSTNKCIFVRVVDTCAGCKKGSKHVDLTRAAFEELAPLDMGILTAQMREASEPTDWNVDLWGPKNN